MYRILLCLALSCFISKNSLAQTQGKNTPVTSQYSELIIGIIGINPADVLSLKGKIEQLTGVHFRAFCHSQQIIALEVDRNFQPDDKQIITAITNFNADYRTFIKTGTISDLEAVCEEKDKMYNY